MLFHSKRKYLLETALPILTPSVAPSHDLSVTKGTSCFLTGDRGNEFNITVLILLKVSVLKVDFTKLGPGFRA